MVMIVLINKMIRCFFWYVILDLRVTDIKYFRLNVTKKENLWWLPENYPRCRLWKRHIMSMPEIFIIQSMPSSLLLPKKPGQSLKKHITPVDVAFYVLRGKGVVEIGNEKEIVEANTLIESPKDIVHCWHNESEEDLAFMVIKVPRPSRETKFISWERLEKGNTVIKLKKFCFSNKNQ